MHGSQHRPRVTERAARRLRTARLRLFGPAWRLAAMAALAAAVAACGKVVPIDPVDAGPPVDVVPPNDELSPIDADLDAPPADAVSPDNANLAELRLSAAGALSPAFDPEVTEYTVSFSLLVQELRVTATPENPDSTLTLDGEAIEPGVPGAPVALALDEQTLSIEVTAPSGETRTYTVTTDRQSDIAQYVYGKSAAPTDNDQMGFAMAVSGDTLAVSVHFEDSDSDGIDGDPSNDEAADSGAVYIFRRVGDAWSQEAYIKASNPDPNDQFGFSLALEGDVLVVGAPGEDSSATGVDGNQNSDGLGSSGAVYVFRRDGTSWSQEAYLKASVTDLNDLFGFSVALSGDTIAIGAEREDSSATGVNGDPNDDGVEDSGAVFVFERTDGAWEETAYVKASNTGANDRFGFKVALEGDRLAVAAHLEDSGDPDNDSDDTALDSGAVYVFRREGGEWNQEAYLKAQVPGGGDPDNTDDPSGDQFGCNISLSGDLLAIGAYREDSSTTGVNGDQEDDSFENAGAAYVFLRADNGTWSQEAYIKASNTGAEDFFGQTVKLSGELLLLGANTEDSNATGIGGNDDDDNASNAGAAYLFRRNSGEWQQEAYIKSSNSGPGDNFGFNLALSPDTMVIAAALEDSGDAGIDADQNNESANNSGAFYIFR